MGGGTTVGGGGGAAEMGGGALYFRWWWWWCNGENRQLFTVYTDLDQHNVTGMIFLFIINSPCNCKKKS